MAFRPSSSLRSRTFIGLLIAQFLAAFNDQAIHASAMFFAFNMRLLNEKEAISLMPILFYAPWAIFCTLAGYCADRFSKRQSLVFWKLAEIGICAVALLGFYLGDECDSKYGPMLVLACVFLMGVHSAFFVPAKYGVMPEILEPQLLSRGNGLLESLSFLAVILGTVCGGVLSSQQFFKGTETKIGIVLLVLAIIGALASLLIEKMPAANPGRPFPNWVYGPLKESLKELLSARPLVFAVVGIAFFTFVVAFMRQTVYMLGESQSPRWDELKTSLVVGSTALGIGLGSPLAGWLSGRKIELGLVPLGGVGMILAALAATLSIHWLPGLVLGIVTIGFFTGFYLVPLYTLLQHRAPKKSKGDAVAISNFINVTGAILASFLFFGLVSAFQKLGYARMISFEPGRESVLNEIKYAEGRVVDYELEGLPKQAVNRKSTVIWASEALPQAVVPGEEPVRVIEQRVLYGGKLHIYLRPANEDVRPIYDNSGLPAFLFAGAALITLMILLILVAIMPDLPSRAVWAFKQLRSPRVRAVGMHHVPLKGPALLATNCASPSDASQLRSATDRLITFVGPFDHGKVPNDAVATASRAVEDGRVVALTQTAASLAARIPCAGPVLPVYVGLVPRGPDHAKRVEFRVSFGAGIPAPIDATSVAEALREAEVADEDYHGH